MKFEKAVLHSQSDRLKCTNRCFHEKLPLLTIEQLCYWRRHLSVLLIGTPHFSCQSGWSHSNEPSAFRFGDHGWNERLDASRIAGVHAGTTGQVRGSIPRFEPVCCGWWPDW